MSKSNCESGHKKHGKRGKRKPLQLEGYDTPEGAARKLGRAESTLARWRRLRIGPKVTYIMGQPVYSHEAEREFLKSCERSMVRNRSRRERQPQEAT
jgi:hypothetical protein